MSLNFKISIAIALMLELFRAWRRSRTQTTQLRTHAGPPRRS
jgi:hypothetical protein